LTATACLKKRRRPKLRVDGSLFRRPASFSARRSASDNAMASATSASMRPVDLALSNLHAPAGSRVTTALAAHHWRTGCAPWRSFLWITRNLLPHLNFFCKNAFHRKVTALSGAETDFGQVFGRGGMSNFQNPKVPPTRGVASAAAHPSSFEMRRTVPASTRGAGDWRHSTLISPEVAEPVG
jgi:hypothetical protein